MNSKGFTLIELIVVMAILGIIATIAVPRFAAYTDIAKEQVCCSNCKTIEKVCEVYLELEDLDHTELLFNQYMIENSYDPCPEGGSISYDLGEVHCSIHNPAEGSEEDGDDESDEGPVPFL